MKIKKFIVFLGGINNMRVNRMTIPDKHFRNYLKNKFNLKWYSKFNPLEITTLKIRDTKIKSLKGIEYFSNLKELDCMGTGISSLDVSKNHKLKTIVCECCEKLTTLDVSKNIELQKLNLGDTGLHDLNLNNNIHLKSIRINRTFIKEIHVAHLRKLKEFDCMGSSMKVLNLSNNKQLQKLACFFCDELTSIDVSGCTKLKSVVGYNSPKLTHLHLGTHPNLEELYLKNTNINELNTSVCPRLKVAEYNPSSMLKINEENFPDKAFREYISNTFDYDCDGILSDEEVANVQEIDISFEWEIQSVKGIECFPNLITLYCDETNIDKLDVRNNPALESLDCGKTEITEINVSQNPALKHLYCYGTNIDKLDVSKNPVLERLYCAGTNIEKLDVSNNPALEDLDCSFTNIKEINVSQNPALKHLNCYNTGLTNLNISNNLKLECLHCHHTGISSIDVRNNPNLNVFGNKDLSVIKENSSIQDKIIQAKDTLSNKQNDTKEVKAKEMER